MENQNLLVGQLVRVLPPFEASFPGIYVIEAVSETGAFQIAGGIDFDPIYLEAVE